MQLNTSDFYNNNPYVYQSECIALICIYGD